MTALVAAGLGMATRRRAGFSFGPEPVDLGPAELGTDAAAAHKVVAICSDPQLKVELVDGETARPVTEADVAEVVAFLEALGEAEAAANALRVDPENPPIDGLPTSDAPESEAAPEGESPAVQVKPAGADVAAPAAEAPVADAVAEVVAPEAPVAKRAKTKTPKA